MKSASFSSGLIGSLSSTGSRTERWASVGFGAAIPQRVAMAMRFTVTLPPPAVISIRPAWAQARFNALAGLHYHGNPSLRPRSRRTGRRRRRSNRAVEVDGRARDRAECWRIVVVQEGPRHSASARLRSSCSKALAMRLISADRAPTALAVSRQVAVTVATSLIIARACGRVKALFSIRSDRASTKLV